MTKASILIPSRRSLAQSVEPIWSAIDFAGRCGISVFVADNSGDQEKQEYFKGAPAHVRYLSSEAHAGVDNLLNGLKEVTTEFVLILGDDDYIAPANPDEYYVLPEVGPDVVAIKPRIELYNSEKTLVATNEFTIDGEDAPRRLMEYTAKMQGGNSSYYSFLRTKTVSDIYALLSAHHPSKIGNMDFAVIYSILAEGRMIHDKDVVIRYDNSRWSDSDTSHAAMSELFATAGLPKEAMSYMTLFHFLDCFVILLRSNSGLAVMERIRASYTVAVIFLNRLVERAHSSPEEFQAAGDLILELRRTMDNDQPDPNAIFHLAGLIADRLKPGLKAAYDQFLLSAIRGSDFYPVQA